MMCAILVLYVLPQNILHILGKIWYTECMKTTYKLFLTYFIFAGILLLQNVVATPVSAALPAGSIPKVIALGDSLTAGTGATSGNDYVSVLSRWSNIPIVNAGISGDTTTDALARIGNITAQDPDIVIVFLGGNDILQLKPLSETISNLRSIVTQLKNSGAQVILVGTHNDTFQSTREREFERLASELDVEYVPNALNGILGHSSLLSDAVHPNDAGYRLIADRLWRKLEPMLNDLVPNTDLSVTCEVQPEHTDFKTGTRWTSYVWGGASPHSYAYTWSGDEDLTGTGRTVSKTYKTEGTKSAQLTVTNGSLTKTVTCRNSTQVTPPPLVGSCSTSVNVRNRGDENDVTVTWSARAAGGNGQYTYGWSGGNGLTGSSTSIEKTYVTAGEKIGTVHIASGNQSIDLECKIIVRGYMLDPDERSPLVGGCSVSGGSFSTDNTITWSARTSGGHTSTTSTSTRYTWDGSNGLDGDTRTVSIKYNGAGTKSGTVEVQKGAQDFSATCQTHIAEKPVNGGSGSSDCFIATAAFGTPMEPQVMLLRDFRDQHLLTNRFGRALVRTYYTISPPIAHIIAKSDTLRAITRALLYPVIETVKLAQK